MSGTDKENKIYIMVAAIDFGTAYSGYAFSMRDDFLKDPLKVIKIQPTLFIPSNVCQQMVDVSEFSLHYAMLLNLSFTIISLNHF